MEIEERQTNLEQDVRMSRFVLRPSLALFLFFLSFYFFTSAGWYQIGDERDMLRVAKKIASSGEVGLLLEEKSDQPEDDVVRGASGKYYYKYGLGQSLIEVPFLLLHRLFSCFFSAQTGPLNPLHAYSMSELMFLLLSSSILSALGCVLIYRFARLLEFSNRISMLLALLYGLCTMVWPYSKSLMAEPALNVTLLGCVYAAVRYRVTSKPIYLLLSGSLMGYAFITKASSVIVAPVLMVYLMSTVTWRRALRHGVLFFVPPLILFGCVQGYHNVIRYDRVLEFGYGFGWDSLGFSTPLLVGLWGLLASPGKSFFLYSPVTILSLLSLLEFVKRKKGEAILFLGIVLVLLVLHACWWAWAGDISWGPRFLVMVVPYLILPAGEFLGSWRRRHKLVRALCIMLIAFSLSVQVLGVAVDPILFPLHRSQMLEDLIKSEGMNPTHLFLSLSYAQFDPMLSHLVGNWWLFKHMIFSYDLWSDPPWKVIKKFDLGYRKPAQEGRVTPFWWPVAFPVIFGHSIWWVGPLVVLNLVLVLCTAWRVKRILKHADQHSKLNKVDPVRG